MAELEKAVVDSGRWQKWLQPDEEGKPFADLAPDRRSWLAQTGARYIWTVPAVVKARQRLYENLALVTPGPATYVVDRIVDVIDRYVGAFHLYDSLSWLDE